MNKSLQKNQQKGEQDVENTKNLEGQRQNTANSQISNFSILKNFNEDQPILLYSPQAQQPSFITENLKLKKYNKSQFLLEQKYKEGFEQYKRLNTEENKKISMYPLKTMDQRNQNLQQKIDNMEIQQKSTQNFRIKKNIFNSLEKFPQQNTLNEGKLKQRNTNKSQIENESQSNFKTFKEIADDYDKTFQQMQMEFLQEKQQRGLKINQRKIKTVSSNQRNLKDKTPNLLSQNQTRTQFFNQFYQSQGNQFFKSMTPQASKNQQTNDNFYSQFKKEQEQKKIKNINQKANSTRSGFCQQQNFKNLMIQTFTSNFRNEDKKQALADQLDHNYNQMNQIKNNAEFNKQFLNKKYYSNFYSNVKNYDKIKQITKVKEKIQNSQIDQEKKTIKEELHQAKPQYLNYDALNSERDKSQEVEFDNFDDQQVFDWNLQESRQLLNRPTIREGSSLTYYKDKLYLYGGFSEKLKDDLFEYDIKKNTWRQVKFDLKQLSIPIESRMGHTANLHGNKLIIFGGEGQYNERIKSRNNFNDILLLDLENFSWSKLHTSVHIIEHRRNHASTIFGNNLFIIGGVNNSEEYLNNVQAVNLENGRVKNYEIPQFKKGIAFHTAMACYKKIFNPSGKKKQHQVKEEGIYIFGGKNQKGKCYNDLYLAKLDEKQKIFEWKILDIQGQKPEPRFGHTMNYLSSSNSLIIYGGKDNDGNFYKDFWVFRLYYQKWIKLDVQGEIERNRHLHCSAINDTNIMYVFGGIDSHKLVSWNLYKVNLQNQISKKKKQIESQIQSISHQRQSIMRSPVMSKFPSFNFSQEELTVPVQLKSYFEFTNVNKRSNRQYK